ILRSVDKLRKIGRDAVQRELVGLIEDQEKAGAILTFIDKEDESEPFLVTLERLERLGGGASEYSERMRTIYGYLEASEIAEHFILDPSITRGLDYYTGLVYETFLTDLPHYGSVCSGGRYNELASLYTREQIPGVGSSIGLDRLMSALEELDSPIADAGKAATVAIFATDYQSFAVRQAAARALRKEGVATSLYLDTKKLGNQYRWAEAQAIPYVLIPEETLFTLKQLESGEVWEAVSIAEAVQIITKDTH
ncbi:MAG TPA: ATP phosphoribosyltransferase regulatory subunit, partial [Sphaerochaeta sp.]|nr:ATP phosphoribosyltransferase regulatory subunit [Sphaerochaeta sp.]